MEGDTSDERPLIQGSIQNEDDAPKGCCSAVLCNPAHACHRFIALILMCTVGFGSYFCYDNPGALQDNFKDDLGINTTQFVLLYSLYSWPNIILCFIGGFLIDRVFGIRLGTLLYLCILLTGALIFATGGYMNIFPLMVFGRFVFGIGGESLAVAQNNYAVRWFKGKELNMVFGLQLSFARVGSTINFIVMEPLYKYVGRSYEGYHRTGVVLYIASLTCVMSLICGLILAWMDRRAESHLNKDNQNKNEEPVKLSAIKYFSGSFWLITVICVAYYVAIFPFVALGKMFFERKFDYSPEDANVVNSIIYILSAVASPVAGLVIDKTGRNLYWVISSIFCTIGAHSMLTFTFWNPYVGMTLLGISYSMLASGLWPLVALIIPENQLGTAYGICQAVQNLGLAIVSIVAGMIVDNGGYFMLEMFFLGALFVALIAAVFVALLDSSQNGILNMSPSQRKDCAERAKGMLPTTEIEESIQNYSVDRNPDETDLVHSNRIRSRYLAKIRTHSDEALINQ